VRFAHRGPIDAALGREGVVLGAGLFFAFPAAGILGHLFLSPGLVAGDLGQNLRGLLRLAFVAFGGALGFALRRFGGDLLLLEAKESLRGEKVSVQKTDTKAGLSRVGGCRAS